MFAKGLFCCRRLLSDGMFAWSECLLAFRQWWESGRLSFSKIKIRCFLGKTYRHKTSFMYTPTDSKYVIGRVELHFFLETALEFV